jgi:hypothetical protein
MAQYRRVRPDAWSRTAQAIVNSTRATSDAWRFAAASRVICDAHLGRTPIEQAQNQVNEIARRAPRPLARLQRASVYLIAADDEPPDDRWARVAELLPGLEREDFSHNQDPMLRTIAAGFVRLGVDESVAVELAFEDFGYAHGPFLQILASQLTRLIEQRLHAGDEQALATCRAILTRILTQWVAEPGPVGLRLLAADLLGQGCDAGVINDPQAADVASKSGTWRAEYRARAAVLPANMLGLSGVPQPCAATQHALVMRIILAGWLVVATVVVGLLAVAGIWPVLRASALGEGLWGWIGRGLVLAAVIVASGLAIVLRTTIATDDVRAGFPTRTYFGTHTWIAACAAILLVLLSGAIPARPKRQISFLCRAAAAGMTGWLIMTAATAIAVRAADSARIDHSAAVASSYQDRLAAVVGAGRRGVEAAGESP